MLPSPTRHIPLVAVRDHPPAQATRRDERIGSWEVHRSPGTLSELTSLAFPSCLACTSLGSSRDSRWIAYINYFIFINDILIWWILAACVRVCVCACMRVCVRACVCACVRVCVCACVRVCVCICSKLACVIESGFACLCSCTCVAGWES